MTEENKNEDIQALNALSKDELFSRLLEIGFSSDKIDHLVNNLGVSEYELALEMLLNSISPSQQSKCCAICQNATNDNFINLVDCSDIFCKDCLQGYVTIRIEEGQVLTMPCPNHECKSQIEDRIIKVLVPETLYDKYLKFKNNEELSKNPYLRWCPQPDCTGSDIGNINKQHLTCNICKFEFCYYCQEAWHNGSKCKQESDKEMDIWAKHYGIKICPNCRRKVEKLKGCDHMTCTKCRYEWCWLCGEKYSGFHYESCEVRLLMKKNPKIQTVLALLALPLAIPLSCVILCCYFIYKEREEFSGLNFLMRHKYLSYIFAVVIGLIFTPVFLAIAPFIVCIVFCIEFFCERCCCKSCGCVSGIIFGLIGTPLFVALVVLGAVIGQFGGVLLVFWKLYIALRRCKNPYFMRPKNNYRF